MEHPFIIGTAGHIDHGKTALVRAMTGVDCDRLLEEKRRGITIELGFAPLTLASGRVVSMVDVPGHERFIRQMTAGASGIDAAMLVVAADEGVMPQTREHLDILGLLGVRSGLIVLSKSDLVDEETLLLAQEEVRLLAKDTFLDGKPLLPVSAVTGEGIDALLAAIDELVSSTPVRSRNGAFFMPLDRAFSMRGFGSVVTGTPYHGTLAEGDEVDILPAGLRCKVRSVQVHGKPAVAAVAGQRTALNLASVALEQLHRGDAVCARGRFSPTECLDVKLSVLPSAPEPVVHWQRLRLHIGTADVVARVSFLQNRQDGKGGEIPPGGSGIVQLLSETPLVAAYGQRFVVRFYSPLETIGGGAVLLPQALRPRNREEREEKQAALQAFSECDSLEARLIALVRERKMIAMRDLFELSQMERADFDRAVSHLMQEQSAAVIGFGESRDCLVSQGTLQCIEESIRRRLGVFHGQHPELAGLGADELYFLLQAGQPPAFPLPDQRDFRSLMRLVADRGVVRMEAADGEDRFLLPDFQPREDAAFLVLVAGLKEAIHSAGFELIDISALPALLQVPPAQSARAIGYLKEKEGLRVIGDGLLFSSEAKDRAHRLIDAMQGDITVASVRDTLGTSRKYALAILEFFDLNGITRRTGDKRTLLKAYR